jgi:hypothetical protein
MAAPLVSVRCIQPTRGLHFAVDISWSCAEAVAWAAIATDATAWERFVRTEYAAQADLARCIFGIPFRAVGGDTAWRTLECRKLRQSGL